MEHIYKQSFPDFFSNHQKESSKIIPELKIGKTVFTTCTLNKNLRTSAHRDKEYYVSSNPLEAITVWIPLGLVNKEYGQLVYLEKSHNFEFFLKTQRYLVNFEPFLRVGLVKFPFFVKTKK